MRTEVKKEPKQDDFPIPHDLMRKAKLDGVDSLTIYGREGVLLILSDELGTMQSIMVVDMLREMAGDLLADIIMKAKDYESKCRKVSIPVAVLEMAGIPEGAPLEINAGDGVLHLSVPDEEDDIDGTLPTFLRDKLSLFDLDISVIRSLIESEDQIHE